MAGISSAGIGSGLDVAGLVQQLVSAERAPAEKRLQRAQSGVQLQISALGALRSALSELKTATDGLKAGGAISALRANSSKTDIFTASAGSGAVAGSYDIEVTSLAKSHKLVSGAYTDADSSVGSGTVSLTVGANGFSVQLTDGANSLAHLRDAINNASDNKGVVATIIKESTGSRLLLTSKNTGTANALTVSGLITTTERQAATDAVVKVEGFSHTSASNTVTGAIDGITLTLASAAPGTVATLSVAHDTTNARGAVDGFVRAYNKMVSTVVGLTKFDPVTKVAGPLIGDAAVRGISDQIRRIVGSEVGEAGAFRMLSNIGVSVQANGTLKLDAARFDEALSSDRRSVETLLGGGAGIGTQLSSALGRYLDDDGGLKFKDTTLRNRQEDLSDQQRDLNRRMGALERRYLAQFTALDQAIGKMRGTSDYLARQLANLPLANPRD